MVSAPGGFVPAPFAALEGARPDDFERRGRGERVCGGEGGGEGEERYAGLHDVCLAGCLFESDDFHSFKEEFGRLREAREEHKD